MNAKITAVDADAIRVMKSAGQEFAERQQHRRLADDWQMGDERQQREHAEHWRQVRERIGEMCDELKRGPETADQRALRLGRQRHARKAVR